MRADAPCAVTPVRPARRQKNRGRGPGRDQQAVPCFNPDPGGAGCQSALQLEAIVIDAPPPATHPRAVAVRWRVNMRTRTTAYGHLADPGSASCPGCAENARAARTAGRRSVTAIRANSACARDANRASPVRAAACNMRVIASSPPAGSLREPARGVRRAYPAGSRPITVSAWRGMNLVGRCCAHAAVTPGKRTTVTMATVVPSIHSRRI